MALLERAIEDSYKKITLKLISSSIEEEKFIKIKNKFLQQIDSPRRLYQTKTLADLIDLLERRLLLQCHNIRLINKIIDDCKIDGIKELIIGHHKLLIESNHDYKLSHYKETDSVENNQSISDHIIPHEVIELISERIGESWKDMAYELGLKGSEVDAIDNGNHNIIKKSQLVLRTFNDRNSNNRRVSLLHALSNIRRNQLKSDVDQLMMKSCINCRSLHPEPAVTVFK